MTIETTEQSHDELVAALVKPGEEIVKELTPGKAHLWHMASCIPGEAGELFDAIKKHVLYGKPLNMTNVVEELGDLEFYMKGLRTALGITREVTLQANLEKLNVRYATGHFSNSQAQQRADKTAEGEPLASPKAQAPQAGAASTRRFLGMQQPPAWAPHAPYTREGFGAELLSDIEITGPDADDFVWLHVTPRDIPQKASFNLGKGDALMAKVLAHFECLRRDAVRNDAAMRKGAGK